MSESFYNDLDLRYPELAYNKAPIYRPEPGIVPFYIPVLYPNISGASVINNNISQNNSNLMNKEKPSIGNITVTNYINIRVPRELCGYLDKTHDVKGNLNIKAIGKSTLISTHTYNLDINNSGGGMSHSHNGSVTIGGGVLENRNFDMQSGENEVNGTLEFAAKDNIIPVDSTWIVIFLGGDINKPIIISRCYL